jgi:hypothetical protein
MGILVRPSATESSAVQSGLEGRPVPQATQANCYEMGKKRPRRAESGKLQSLPNRRRTSNVTRDQRYFALDAVPLQSFNHRRPTGDLPSAQPTDVVAS